MSDTPAQRAVNVAHLSSSPVAYDTSPGCTTSDHGSAPSASPAAMVSRRCCTVSDADGSSQWSCVPSGSVTPLSASSRMRVAAARDAPPGAGGAKAATGAVHPSRSEPTE